MWPGSPRPFSSSSAWEPLELSGNQSEQQSPRSHRAQVQRRLRWQPYSVVNLFLASEQETGTADSPDQEQNKTFLTFAKRLANRRLALTRVQSNPEFDFRREDMPRKRGRILSPLREESPSRVLSFELPIAKSSSEEEVNKMHFPLSCESIKNNGNPLSMDSDILSGYRKRRSSSISPRAQVMAIKLIKHARAHKVVNERMLWCRNCDGIPINPVTGPCGHTRCKECVERHGGCPCGAQAPEHLFVDVATRKLINMMFQECDSDVESFENNYMACGSSASTSIADRLCGYSSGTVTNSSQTPRELSPRVPMTPQARLMYARSLISAGQLHEAGAQLARVAAYSEPVANTARTLLEKTLSSLLNLWEPSSLTTRLTRLIQHHATNMWLEASDLECSLCLSAYRQPVTTPCGHTFCRICIERLLDYKKPCALCKYPLYKFDLSMTADSVFISAALEAIDELKVPKPLGRKLIYIIGCTVAFPMMPCPLVIFGPRYWFVIRRVLKSKTRTFGMVACDSEGDNCEYGTLLEIRDCVLLEDGSFILSTVGVSRFHVVETDVRDGCDVARIEIVADNIPSDARALYNLNRVAYRTRVSAMRWLRKINPDLRNAMEAAFGVVPKNNNRGFWQTSDGPAWLWWFLSVLPLKMEIKVLVLSTTSALKRLSAVNRVLLAIKNIRPRGRHIIMNSVERLLIQRENLASL